MSNPRARILIVEDEIVSREKLAAYLRKESFDVWEAADRATMQTAMRDHPFDLVLLDINLPDGDGIEIARDLRAASDVGIIFVTARTDDVDKIVGIEVGADDYVTKPYNARELLARIRGLLRRTERSTKPPEESPVYSFGPWQLDVLRRKLVRKDGKSVKLTRGELELLHTFLRKPGIVLSRDFLLDHINHRVWAPNDRSIDVMVGRLRRTIEEDPKSPTMIVTAHGEGYVFAESVDSS